MRRVISGLLVAIMLSGLSFAWPATASAQEHDMCEHDTTIVSLVHCVHHATEMGHIGQAGVATSLLAKLNAAQAQLDQGQTRATENILRAFIYEVAAQSGKSIAAEHATHLIEHAQHVIAALPRT